METYDNRISIYIEKSAEFAKPILNHLREIIHKASPEIKETVKWGFPHFDCKGTICSMASFKLHCTFGFWKSSLMDDPYGLLNSGEENAMGQFGKITSVDQLPPSDVLISYLHSAISLNNAGTKVKKPVKEPHNKTIEVPEDFINILTDFSDAKTIFENLSYSHKKEYVEWFADAKTDTTRLKRMNTAVEWLTEGKSRHWKYQK